MKFGLIGETLAHSFSAKIHKAFGRYDYTLWPLAPEQLQDFLLQKDFSAINVTIPYKQDIIPYCTKVEKNAQRIGAVNTVLHKKGELHGYNTDYAGFSYLVQTHGITLAEKVVLILGDGGTTRTVQAVAQDAGAKEILVASRRPKEGRISYQRAAERKDVDIIINASPVGMYPNNGTMLIDLDDFPLLEAVFDAVYNPLVTELLYQAKKRDLIAVNGLEMLVAQAKYAGDLFLSETLPQDLIPKVVGILQEEVSNITLIGMPGSGKSSLGRELAKRCGKTFVDIDGEIEKQVGKAIPEIFATEGEAKFRQYEHELTARFAKETGQIIATGGGVILDPANIKALAQNGPTVWIDATVEQLSLSSYRPLSKTRQELEAMYQQRYPLYKQSADYTLAYHPDFSQNIERLWAIYQAIFTDK